MAAIRVEEQGGRPEPCDWLVANRSVPRIVHGRFITPSTCGSALGRRGHRVSRAKPTSATWRPRGVCPSCNGRRMAQTAAPLADHVIPPIPVRHWVISVPQRLRGFLADRPRAVAAVTKIFLDEIERLLLAAPGGTPDADMPRAAPCRDRQNGRIRLGRRQFVRPSRSPGRGHLPARSSRGGQVEAVEVHHLGPGRDEVVDEPLLAVRGGVDLRNRPQLGV